MQQKRTPWLSKRFNEAVVKVIDKMAKGAMESLRKRLMQV